MKNWSKGGGPSRIFKTAPLLAAVIASAGAESRAYAVAAKIGPGLSVTGPFFKIRPIALLRLDAAPSPLAVTPPWALQASPVKGLRISAALPAPAVVVWPQEAAFQSLQTSVKAQARLGQDLALDGDSDSLSQKAGMFFDGPSKAAPLTADPVLRLKRGELPAGTLIKAAKEERSSFKAASPRMPPLMNRNRGFLDTKLANALSVVGVAALAAGAAVAWIPAPVLAAAVATLVLAMITAFMAGGLAEMIAEAAKASEKTKEAAVAWSVLAAMLAVVVPMIALTLF